MSLWLASQPLVLASKSEARQAMLAHAGIRFDVHPADLDERAVEAGSAGQSADAIALHLAQVKAQAVARVNPGRLVLGADQTLALGARKFDKPADLAAARAQLLALSGQTHLLHSALAFSRDGETLFSTVETARLTMRPLTERFVDDYLAEAGAVVTKSVGAYQLERLGVHLFARIEGDHFTILGMPLITVLAFLRMHGCIAG